MVNWWFGILGVPLSNTPFHKGMGPRNPKHQTEPPIHQWHFAIFPVPIVEFFVYFVGIEVYQDLLTLTHMVVPSREKYAHVPIVHHRMYLLLLLLLMMMMMRMMTQMMMMMMRRMIMMICQFNYNSPFWLSPKTFCSMLTSHSVFKNHPPGHHVLKFWKEQLHANCYWQW